MRTTEKLSQSTCDNEAALPQRPRDHVQLTMWSGACTSTTLLCVSGNSVKPEKCWKTDPLMVLGAFHCASCGPLVAYRMTL